MVGSKVFNRHLLPPGPVVSRLVTPNVEADRNLLLLHQSCQFEVLIETEVSFSYDQNKC